DIIKAGITQQDVCNGGLESTLASPEVSEADTPHIPLSELATIAERAVTEESALPDPVVVTDTLEVPGVDREASEVSERSRGRPRALSNAHMHLQARKKRLAQERSAANIARFVTLLQSEVDACNLFHHEHLRLAEERVASLITRLSSGDNVDTEAYESVLKKRMFDEMVHLFELIDHAELNLTALRKICKKADRRMHSHLLDSNLHMEMRDQPFSDTSRLEELTTELGDAFSAYCTRMGEQGEEQRAGLLSAVESSLSWKKNPYLVDWGAHQAKAQLDLSSDKEEQREKEHKVFSVTLKDVIFIILALIVGVSCSVFVTAMEATARRCLGIVLGASILWGAEALPLHVTALVIPFVVCVSYVLKDSDTDEVLAPGDAASEIISGMMSGTVLLVLAGFSLSVAMAKYKVDEQIAGLVLTKVAKSKPKRFLALLMIMNYVLSCYTEFPYTYIYYSMMEVRSRTGNYIGVKVNVHTLLAALQSGKGTVTEIMLGTETVTQQTVLRVMVKTANDTVMQEVPCSLMQTNQFPQCKMPEMPMSDIRMFLAQSDSSNDIPKAIGVALGALMKLSQEVEVEVEVFNATEGGEEEDSISLTLKSACPVCTMQCGWSNLSPAICDDGDTVLPGKEICTVSAQHLRQ
ncbi:checkpoint protein Hus1/Mec3, partial [Kipferlia bialata]